jgi:hypothetical protein
LKEELNNGRGFNNFRCFKSNYSRIGFDRSFKMTHPPSPACPNIPGHICERCDGSEPAQPEAVACANTRLLAEAMPERPTDWIVKRDAAAKAYVESWVPSPPSFERAYSDGYNDGFSAGQEANKVRVVSIAQQCSNFAAEIDRLTAENKILRNQLEEIWKPYPHRPDLLVSNKGRLRFDSTRSGYENCTGYMESWVKIGGTARRITVHKMVMEAHVGPRPDGMEINHKNGCKTDNRLENLEYVTRSQNIRHAISTGLIPSQAGQRNNNSKLNAEKVGEIRSMAAKGLTNVAIAKIFGVHHGTIGRIVNGETWKESK